ncbi:FAD-dependent oxidoreductase [Haloferax sp. MBLA0076]|uniref:FAD-dependent oxidoreductase n=1 Tax=Haloferax litoreum TaxID=2666140 RepID=A0A6A8GKC1_9EURY|nr:MULTISPECIES: FAD-binding oxidoreductase [Haloferax]KAB1190568.1 FAD-binding oxidoreductase [Haloferax sp. CBA1148]MRX23555.1 FAD-dependent oxidoreductase [Haloferax litoreum]
MTHATIIGAGAVGVSAAHHLAERGIEVTLVDKGHAAGETTGKAGGLVFCQLHEPADVRAMGYSIDFFRDLSAAENHFTYHEVGFLRTGTEREHSAFEREVSMQQNEGANVRLVDPPEISEIYPTLSLDGVTVGTYAPGDGYADPHTFTTTLLDEARAKGVTYRPGTKVTDIDVSDTPTVETEAGPIQTDTVVIAAGPWSRRVAALTGVDLPVKPYRAQALVTTPVAFDIGTVYDAHEGVYFRSEQRGGLLVGDGTEEVESDPDGYTQTADFDFLVETSDVVERCLPVDDVGIQNAWAGLCTATPDGRPLVGRPVYEPGSDGGPDDVVVAAGLQGHGFMRSPAVGHAVADIVCDGESEYPEWRPDRFDEHPGDFDIEEMLKLDGKHPGLQ